MWSGSWRIAARIVVETEHWLAVVPFSAAWPFETLLLPKAHVPSMLNLTKAHNRIWQWRWKFAPLR
ncbi:hypothetical protein ACLK2G_04080 [Escherichia coli]